MRVILRERTVSNAFSLLGMKSADLIYSRAFDVIFASGDRVDENPAGSLRSWRKSESSS